MDASSHFRGKKITVMGLGLLGRGVGDAAYLARCGAELIVTDLKTREQLATSLAELAAFPGITYVLGEHRLEDFRGRHMILKAAGVPRNSPYVLEAETQGIPVRMSADLFAEYAGVPVIGITGTRGKSTTAHLLADILAAGRKRVLLGGNVRGVSTLALLDSVQGTGDEVAVLELDSWQLQGFGAAKMSPHIAVFTTFFPDHLNYYDGDLNAYLADKANIFLNQEPDDTLVVGSQCSDLIRKAYGDGLKQAVLIADTMDVPMDWAMRIPGEHNRYDAACALVAARACGVEDAASKLAIESFRGVPGRLEFIRDVNGVKVYNDTNSTTPEATIAALKALDTGDKNIVIIMGGNDKNLDMAPLLVEMPQRAKRVIMLAGTGTSRVLQWLPEASVYDSLETAVAEAFKSALPGDTILFSPAFASFGMFANEYDRGDQFNAIVQKL